MDEIRMYLGAMGEGTLLAFATIVEEDPTGYLAEMGAFYFEEKAREVRDKLQSGGMRPEDLSGIDAVILQSLNQYEADQREDDEAKQKKLALQPFYGQGETPPSDDEGLMPESIGRSKLKIILG